MIVLKLEVDIFVLYLLCVDAFRGPMLTLLKRISDGIQPPPLLLKRGSSSFCQENQYPYTARCPTVSSTVSMQIELACLLVNEVVHGAKQCFQHSFDVLQF